MVVREYPVDVVRVRDGRAPTGTTVLVDRLWPRGQRKAEAPWDEWLRAVAPSTELRRWYAHDPERFEEFARRYRRELEGGEQGQAGEQAQAFADLARRHRDGPVTLVTATRDLDHSHARVLADLLSAGS